MGKEIKINKNTTNDIKNEYLWIDEGEGNGKLCRANMYAFGL
jgi:hypothetical protein